MSVTRAATVALALGLLLLRRAEAAVCFHGGDTVRTPEGAVRMAQLAVGSSVLAYDEASGRAVYSPVVSWLHREPHAVAKFMHLRTYAGRALRVTPNHIVYRVPLCRRNTDAEKVRAASLRHGDCLLTGGGEGEGAMSRDRLVFIQRHNGTGIYAPATDIGTVLVQGVAASCVANERHSALAHWALAVNELLGRLSALCGTESGGSVRLSSVYKAALALRHWLSLDQATVAPVPVLF